MRLNECYSVPDHVVAGLRQYDPLLRLKWGRAEGTVRLERKVTRPLSGEVFTLASEVPLEAYDDFESCDEGYSLITKFPPYESNWPKILYTLALTDLQRIGGARAVSDMLEADEQYKKERRTWNRRDDFREMAVDLYKHMNRIKTVPEGAGYKPYGSFE